VLFCRSVAISTRRIAVLANYVPLIAATGVVLVILAFVAEASSD
jgi:hypothetical protein